MNSTPTLESIETGDVVEFLLAGTAQTALVLLAGDEALILDLCDGSMPLVAKLEELDGLRRFEPDTADLFA